MALAMHMHEFPHWVEPNQRKDGITTIQTTIGTDQYHEKKEQGLGNPAVISLREPFLMQV
jgi:hypothetical protein